MNKGVNFVYVLRSMLIDNGMTHDWIFIDVFLPSVVYIVYVHDPTKSYFTMSYLSAFSPLAGGCDCACQQVAYQIIKSVLYQ